MGTAKIGNMGFGGYIYFYAVLFGILPCSIILLVIMVFRVIRKKPVWKPLKYAIILCLFAIIHAYTVFEAIKTT